MGSANSVEVLSEGGSLGVADPRRRDAAAVPEAALAPPRVARACASGHIFGCFRPMAPE
jgi:hypothetical protein